jgi:HD-GYP domain-containing protein (c-di-GMP phosphodiesterase class II)
MQANAHVDVSARKAAENRHVHEHLDGSGYPRKLGADRLSVQARIMAIADIFEALTAADRPYKRGKMLSEAVSLLAERVRCGHLDRDLFELLLRDGVYQRYAERFLDPQQIDAVDIEANIAIAGRKLPGNRLKPTTGGSHVFAGDDAAG